MRMKARFINMKKNINALTEQELERIEKIKYNLIEYARKELDADEEGDFELDVPYRYDEGIKNIVNNIFNADYPRDYFNELVDDDERNDTYRALEYEYEQFMKTINEADLELLDKYDYQHLLWEDLNESFHGFYSHLSVLYPQVEVNIMYKPNEETDSYMGRVYPESNPLENNQSIKWLLEQQGMSKDNTLLADEIEGYNYDYAALTFLCNMNMNDLFRILDIRDAEKNAENCNGKEYITIPKSAMCGLFDPWNGGGSYLGIELLKDVKIPLKNCIIQVETHTLHGTMEEFNYGVDTVYGLCGSAWQAEAKLIED